MKINIQKFARVVIPFVSALLIVIVSVAPVSATGIDYNDYISRVEVDGSNDLVTVTIPAELCFVRVYDYTSRSDIYTGYGASHTFEALTGHSYAFQMWPFGYPWGADGGLDISNIPDGTSGTVSFSSNVDVGGDTEQHSATAYFTYRNENQIVVEHSYVDYTYTPGSHDFDFVVNPPSNATVLEFEDSVGFAVFDDGSYNFTVNDTVLVMSISSLYRLQQETGKTNTILAEVQKQLESNGQKLEDIISGSSDQQNQAGQFKDEIGSVSGALVGAGSAISGVPKPTIVVDDLVPSDVLNGSAYLSYVTTIQEFWKSETLSSVTIILGGLILVSYILFGEKG